MISVYCSISIGTMELVTHSNLIVEFVCIKKLDKKEEKQKRGEKKTKNSK